MQTANHQLIVTRQRERLQTSVIITLQMMSHSKNRQKAQLLLTMATPDVEIMAVRLLAMWFNVFAS